MDPERLSLQSEFYGQDILFSRWQKSMSSGRLPHAILLSGDSENENLKMAWVLSQSLLCEKQTVNPCGECGSCYRIKTKNSESILEVKPIKNLIRLEELRDFSQFFNLRGWQNKKVIILHQAHFLNASAANRLLKSIEEPPENTFFFLTTDSPRQVISTLRSRSQNLPIASRESRAIANDEVLNHVFSFFKSLVSPQSNFLISKTRDDFRDRNFTKLWLQSAQSVLRDLLFYKNESSVINQDRIEEIDSLAQAVPSNFWQKLFDKVLDQEQGARHNLDSQLQFEKLYIQMRQLKEGSSHGMD